jgi:hypothetical protein
MSKINVYRTLILAIIGGAALSFPAKPATADNRYNIVGIGRSTCAEYTKALADNPKEVKSQFAVWAYGFLSGMNVAKYPETKDFSSIFGMGTDAFVKDVNLYCNQHALETLDRALVAFYARLPSTPPPRSAADTHDSTLAHDPDMMMLHGPQ